MKKQPDYIAWVWTEVLRETQEIRSSVGLRRPLRALVRDAVLKAYPLVQNTIHSADGIADIVAKALVP